MSELLLDSLEIKGYRCFEHLTIEKLGRVNLIVGKNNVGKTALLEALWVYSEGSNWIQTIKVLNYLLEKRYEKETIIKTREFPIITQNSGLHFRHLFYERNLLDRATTDEKLKFSIDSGKLLDFIAEIGAAPKNLIEIIGEYKDNSLLISPTTTDIAFFHEEIKSLFVESNGLNLDLLTEIWDDVILRNEEDEPVNALKIISKDIIDLNFINYPKGCKQRVPVVRTKNIKERVPLSSLGEGMTRLLGIALALVNCKNGFLFIDEIEIGLHYSVLPDVWKLIFKTAKDLNVQVFATTHSRDCIEAFAQAAYDSPEDGMLIRLERHGEKIVAKSIEEEMLVDAVNYEVEVR